MTVPDAQRTQSRVVCVSFSQTALARPPGFWYRCSVGFWNATKNGEMRGSKEKARQGADPRKIHRYYRDGILLCCWLFAVAFCSDTAAGALVGRRELLPGRTVFCVFVLFNTRAVIYLYRAKTSRQLQLAKLVNWNGEGTGMPDILKVAVTGFIRPPCDSKNAPIQ